MLDVFSLKYSSLRFVDVLTHSSTWSQVILTRCGSIYLVHDTENVRHVRANKGSDLSRPRTRSEEREGVKCTQYEVVELAEDRRK